jgi:hypothetical protein
LHAFYLKDEWRSAEYDMRQQNVPAVACAPQGET